MFNIFTYQENANKITLDCHYMPTEMTRLQKIGIIKVEGLKQQRLKYMLLRL